MDTYAYIYNNTFDPTSPSLNVILKDDGIDIYSQCLLSIDLDTITKYILVLTTFYPNVTGTFTITGFGVGSLGFSPINISNPLLDVDSIYSSSLNDSSKMFCREINCSQGYFYYQSIDLNISKDGYYTIRCYSNIDTYGYIYNKTFNYYSPSENILSFNDDYGGNSQFMFNMFLNSLTKYILVVTTYSSNVKGSYSIIVSGPEYITFIVQ
ncbi:unnamed protein product [Rotaria sp. Silwood1]|nr:unnamed protein product [Rotaria sp. Silwood1]